MKNMEGVRPASWPGNRPSKTGVNALIPGHPRLPLNCGNKTWMPGTRPGMTESLSVGFYAFFFHAS
jgi:hypothetical protein